MSLFKDRTHNIWEQYQLSFTANSTQHKTEPQSLWNAKCQYHAKNTTSEITLQRI